MKTVLTTIFDPTHSVLHLLDCLGSNASDMIVIGDKKGPESYDLPGCIFYPLEKQYDLPFRISKLLPTGHYSRKNIGYLLAMAEGEVCIYETDDDNAPNQYWQTRDKQVKALMAEPASWINVYRHFSVENIWPRGFLLDRILDPETIPAHDDKLKEVSAPIQQGLADLAPDVDAIWRLTLNRDFYFERPESIILPFGAWCPFNTQSTWWWKEAFPLLYLPSNCSFRMTDIWKSFIAQRCLWAMGYGIVFHPPEVIQERNEHNLMRDFEAEVQGYTLNEKLTKTLEDLDLSADHDNALENLVRCYEALIAMEIFPGEEMKLVKTWVEDVEHLLF